jgi:hypothetical protein
MPIGLHLIRPIVNSVKAMDCTSVQRTTSSVRMNPRDFVGLSAVPDGFETFTAFYTLGTTSENYMGDTQRCGIYFLDPSRWRSMDRERGYTG